MRAMVKRRKCPSLLIFHRIKKGQKRRSHLNWKIRPPPFLWFFYPSKIEGHTAFSLRLVVHALCSDQLYGCTCKLFSSLCTFVQKNLAPAWPQYDVSTCWNLIGQKEASRTTDVDGRRSTDDGRPKRLIEVGYPHLKNQHQIVNLAWMFSWD